LVFFGRVFGKVDCSKCLVFFDIGVRVGIYDYKFDVHGSVHCRLLNRNTNKIQLCNRIYYSKVYNLVYL